MALLVLRHIVGFLVQIAPCAALCLMPFAGRYTRGARRAFSEAAFAVGVPLAAFVALDFAPFPEGAGETRMLAQNVVFAVSLAALFAVYVRNVCAGTAQKAFAFFAVACYGFVATLASNALVGIVVADRFQDEYLYQPTFIVALVVVNAVLFGPMAATMRRLGKLFSMPIDERAWKRLAALPAIVLCIMFFVSWLPGIKSEWEMSYYFDTIAMSAMVVFFLWWAIRSACDIAAGAQRATQLADALRTHREERAALKSELARAHAAVSELERAVADRDARTATEEDDAEDSDAAGSSPQPDGDEEENAPIVIATSTHAVSFRPDDVLYAESLNRARIIHLVGGEELRVSTTLAQIADLLPAGRFAYCHRSVVVNLDYVVEATPTEVLLRGGEKVPMSRRRLADLTRALAARANA